MQHDIGKYRTARFPYGFIYTELSNRLANDVTLAPLKLTFNT